MPRIRRATFRLATLAAVRTVALLALLAPAVALAQSTGTLRAFGGAAYSLAPRHVAVVVNELDPHSVAAGEYYRERRNLPPGNVVRVRIDGSPPRITRAELDRLRAEIDAAVAPDVQVLALAWTAPYAVECNGITAALTLGFDAALCSNGCGAGRTSPYFDSRSVRPHDDHGLRLAMLLPVQSIESARTLVDRGVAADAGVARAGAYFVVTADTPRNTRARFFPRTARLAAPPLDVVTLQAESLRDRRDVMLYLIGAVNVADLDTIGFLPGALADHLTSFGGDLLGSGQMSSLRWLEAGATASYGTVSEPCNHWQKFPHPTVLLRHYLAGASAIEAYWKSVAWPAQGVFIGEPLASPYRRRSPP
jgi:uncharacterized protein (TIGR03790 family)